jgi:hypothetical protein
MLPESNMFIHVAITISKNWKKLAKCTRLHLARSAWYDYQYNKNSFDENV